MTRRSNPSRKCHCMVVFSHYPAGETRVQRQAEALIKNGFEVDILCLRAMRTGYQAPEEVVNGAQVYRLRTTRSYGNIGFVRQILEYVTFFIHVMLALIRLYPNRRYDTIQVHNLPDFLIFAAWFPKLLGARLILDIHDLMPEFFASRSGRNMNSWLVRLITWQEWLSCHFANHVITVTEMWRRVLIQRGVPADRVSVIMNVADHSIFNRSVNNAFPKEDGTFRLFYHGGWVRRYGIDLVLEAMAQLQSKIPGLRFTIHGGGSYEETLIQLVDQLGLEDQVDFSTKYCAVADLPRLICTADLAVVPYQSDVFTDGILPTKLMEYTALGIPAIVARTPAIEAYFDDTMVEFFEPNNAQDLANRILALYNDRPRLKALVEQSDEFNQKYNWTKQQSEYIALIERIQL